MGCGNWKGTQSPGEMKQECTRKWGWGPCSPADRHSSMCTCECAQGSGGSGLLTDGSVKTEEGALAGPDSASPTGTSKSWEKGLELGG